MPFLSPRTVYATIVITLIQTLTLYKAAGLTNNDVEKIIRGLWNTMNSLHLEVFGKEIAGDEYPGTDIRVLTELRDAASA